MTELQSGGSINRLVSNSVFGSLQGTELPLLELLPSRVLGLWVTYGNGANSSISYLQLHAPYSASHICRSIYLSR
jgi:hypothetical protein